MLAGWLMCPEVYTNHYGVGGLAQLKVQIFLLGFAGWGVGFQLFVLWVCFRFDLVGLTF